MMKKPQIIRVLLLAGIVGLVAVPTIASARQGADDPAGHVRQEDRRSDRRADRQQDRTSTIATNSVATPSSNETIVDGIKVETEVALPEGSITLAEARDIAQGQRPDGTIFKVEIEVEEGVVVYSFRFTDDGRVDVSATDGTVTRVRDGRTTTVPSNSSGDDNDDDNSSNSSSNDDNDDENEDEDDDDRSGSNRGRR